VVDLRSVGRGRTLLFGGPFSDREAVDAAIGIRAAGWTADVRPEGGGHLAAWQAHTRPVIVDGRLWVCFPWSEFDRDQARTVVEIDPDGAFGTGGHPTTRMLLAQLVGRIEGGESVLDVGCGSGVLAVAAALLGAASVTAVDISPAAIAATTANAVRNQVGKRVVVSGTPVAELTDRFDVIVANIHAAGLRELAPALLARMAPGGWVGLSGLSPAQVSLVAAAYRPASVIATPVLDDWAALVVVAPAVPGENPPVDGNSH